MKKLLAAIVILAAPPIIGMLLLWKMIQELEHVADNLADDDMWWNDTFDGYEWDDDWVDGGWSEQYDPA